MKRLVTTLLLTTACAPDQPQETVRCQSLSDCSLGQVCNQPAGNCIDEPSNRFLGSFQCTVDAMQNLQPAEIVGRVGSGRWSLASAFCQVTPKGDQILLGFSDLFAGDQLTVSVATADALTQRVALKPFFDVGDDAASFENGNTFTAYGYSSTGTVTFSSRPTPGSSVTGYLDVSMYPVVDADALFGAACPRGRADCGKKTLEAGGVALCASLQDGPFCTRTCSGNGDCSVGNGACVDTLCTKACTKNADCDPSLRCIAASIGQGSGCL
jgi:hypothetical protein